MAVKDLHPMTIRFDDADYEMLKYWSSKYDLTFSELLAQTLHTYVRVANHDFPVDDILVNRMNQIIDLQQSNNSTMESLSEMMASFTDTFFDMVRGTNYLIREQAERDDEEVR